MGKMVNWSGLVYLMNFLALFNLGAVWKFDMLPLICLYMNKQNIKVVVVYVKKKNYLYMRELEKCYKNII